MSPSRSRSSPRAKSATISVAGRRPAVGDFLTAGGCGCDARPSAARLLAVGAATVGLTAPTTKEVDAAAGTTTAGDTGAACISAADGDRGPAGAGTVFATRVSVLMIASLAGGFAAVNGGDDAAGGAETLDVPTR